MKVAGTKSEYDLCITNANWPRGASQVSTTYGRLAWKRGIWVLWYEDGCTTGNWSANELIAIRKYFSFTHWRKCEAVTTSKKKKITVCGHNMVEGRWGWNCLEVEIYGCGEIGVKGEDAGQVWCDGKNPKEKEKIQKVKVPTWRNKNHRCCDLMVIHHWEHPTRHTFYWGHQICLEKWISNNTCLQTKFSQHCVQSCFFVIFSSQYIIMRQKAPHMVLWCTSGHFYWQHKHQRKMSQMSLKRPVAFRQTGLNVRLFQSLCTERDNNVYGFTVNDPWRHSRRNDVRQWRETMGALCCWLPSSLQIGRLRGDGVGWWEVCVRVRARALTHAQLLGYSEWILKGSEEKTAERTTLPDKQNLYSPARHFGGDAIRSAAFRSAKASITN